MGSIQVDPAERSVGKISDRNLHNNRAVDASDHHETLRPFPDLEDHDLALLKNRCNFIMKRLIVPKGIAAVSRKYICTCGNPSVRYSARRCSYNSTSYMCLKAAAKGLWFSITPWIVWTTWSLNCASCLIRILDDLCWTASLPLYMYIWPYDRFMSGRECNGPTRWAIWPQTQNTGLQFPGGKRRL